MQSQQMQERGNFSAASGFCQLTAAVLVCAALWPFPLQPRRSQYYTNSAGWVTPARTGRSFRVSTDICMEPHSSKRSGANTVCATKGCGTVFRIGRYGGFTTVYSFCNESCSDGAYPGTGLIEGPYGAFYGTTAGTLLAATGYGTIFRITAEGALNTLYHFCSATYCNDGRSAELDRPRLRRKSLRYYACGGVKDRGVGTIYRLTPGGKFTIQHIFCRQNPSQYLSRRPDAIQPYPSDRRKPLRDYFFGRSSWRRYCFQDWAGWIQHGV